MAERGGTSSRPSLLSGRFHRGFETYGWAVAA
jgi:hypothetical protein